MLFPSMKICGRGETDLRTTATQLDATAGGVPCRLVVVKARKANTGAVYVADSVTTTADGSTDLTTGLELSPSEREMFPVSNVNELYGAAATDHDDVTWIAYK